MLNILLSVSKNYFITTHKFMAELTKHAIETTQWRTRKGAAGTVQPGRQVPRDGIWEKTVILSFQCFTVSMSQISASSWSCK